MSATRRAEAIAIIVLSATVLSSGSSRGDETSPPAAQNLPSRDLPATAPREALPPNALAVPVPGEISPPPSVSVIDAVDARGILGRDIRSPANENMGRIVDVIVDRGGSARAAVIDFGGFLGVGSRKIVVDWSALHFWNVANKGESITLELTRDQVKAAPEYKEDKPMIVLGASGSLAPLRFVP